VFYSEVEKMFPGAPKLEMFARGQRRLGRLGRSERGRGGCCESDGAATSPAAFTSALLTSRSPDL
jgi:hypothetical protein